MVERLLEILNSVHPISNPLKTKISSIIQTKHIPQKCFLLKEGQISNHIYFIDKGFVRSFYIKDDKEITAWFMRENDFVVSVNSFYKREKSYEYIQALESCIVHYIHYNDLEKLYKEFVELNINGRLLTIHYYIQNEERLFSMRKKSAEERYRLLQNKHPEIIQRAPLGYIASYLGISQETLSRIRSRR